MKVTVSYWAVEALKQLHEELGTGRPFVSTYTPDPKNPGKGTIDLDSDVVDELWLLSEDLDEAIRLVIQQQNRRQ